MDALRLRGAEHAASELSACNHAHIVVRHSDTTTDRRMRQARNVRFRERDEPLDTVPSVILMIRPSNLQLRRRDSSGSIGPMCDLYVRGTRHVPTDSVPRVKRSSRGAVEIPSRGAGWRCRLARTVA